MLTLKHLRQLPGLLVSGSVGVALGILPVAAQSTAPTSDPSLLAQDTLQPRLDESLDELRATFTQIEAIQVPDLAISAPGYTIAVPSGYGVSFGTIYLAAGGVFERRFDDGDGQAGIGVGVGLGNPNQWLGVDVNYVLGDVEEGLGGFSFKVHRNLIINDQVGWAAAVGWEDFATTGEPSRDSSVYGSTSVILKLRPDINQAFSRLALTVGVGGGRFRTEDDILNGESTVGVFGSGALRVSRAVSVIGEWTGQDLAAGVSFAPLSDVSFYITPSLRDIAGAGDNVRFAVSAGLSYQF